MPSMEEYLRLISRRGDRYGGNGGLLQLLDWCGKLGVRDVTEEEARRFWEDPNRAYRRNEGMTDDM